MTTSETVVNTIIASIIYIENLYRKRGYNYNYKKTTHFESLNDELIRFYEYTGNNVDFKSLYSFNEFTNLFYDAICYDEELPEYVQEKFIVYFKTPIKVTLDEEYANSVCNEIKACILQAKLDNVIKDFWIKDNDRKTKKVRELVFRNRHECNSAALVRPLITWAKNHNRLNYEFIYKMFEYGYIMGKRTERTRKKKI